MVVAVASAGCGSGSSAIPAPDQPTRTVQGGEASGSGAPGGGFVIPQPSTDAPDWFVYNGSKVIGAVAPAHAIDFGALQNTVQGAMEIGTTRTAQILIYNISKKADLIITSATLVGANPGDFTLDPAYLAVSLNHPIRKSFGAAVDVSFTPTAKGVRTASVQLVSNAGTVLVELTGTALAPKPKIGIDAVSLSFLPASAFDTVSITNKGGKTLALQSITIGGAAPASFVIAAANRGFSNCFDGILLGPMSTCFVGVGVAAGAPAPSSAVLTIVSNDPVHPEKDIPLTLTP